MTSLQQLLFLSLFLTLSARAQGAANSAELSYDEVFPLYTEVCSYTQFERPEYGTGHRGGHSTIYLKGVCRDESAKIPLLKLCDELQSAQTLADIPTDKKNSPEWGVNVSVDDHFANVNWVAVPGKRLAYDGVPSEVKAQAVVDQKAMQAALSEAMRLRLFRGIEVTPKALAKFSQRVGYAPESLERIMAEQAIGTDYAIRYARQATCARVPVSRFQLQRMVDMLNDKQQDAYTKGNFWDGINNNCTHTVQQALAAAGIRSDLWNLQNLKVKGLARKIIKQLTTPSFVFWGQIAVPSNETITLARLSNVGLSGLDPEAIYAKRNHLIRGEYLRREALMDPLWSWLPKQPGSMTQVLNVLSQASDSPFVPHPDTALVLAFPPLNELMWFLPKNGKVEDSVVRFDLLHRKSQKEEIERDSSLYRDPEAHVAYYQKLLLDAKAKYATRNPRPKDKEFTDFWNQYVQSLDEKIELLEQIRKIRPGS